MNIQRDDQRENNICKGSPVTNNHYLGAPHGEIYGLDHCSERFDPLMIAKLRSELFNSSLHYQIKVRITKLGF